MNPVVKRVIASLGANAFGQGVTIIIQLFSLPLFLHKWDASTYGTWLMISAIPAYLSMADVGMVSTTGNRMTMDMGQGRSEQANAVFQSALVFMLVTCGLLAVITLPAILFAPIPGLQTLDHRVALAALVCGVLLALFGGLSEAMFRATGRYANGTTIANLTRLAEWGGWVVGLLIWGTFSAVALSGLAARLTGTVLLAVLAPGGQSDIRWGVLHAQWHEVRTMVRPAFSFMLFPLSNALTFQGVTLLVGNLFGPAVVATFNTYRTLARVAVQLTSTFSFAVWTEFSRLYGAGGATAVEPLYRRSNRLGAILAIGTSIMLFICGPWLLKVWTHGVIPYDAVLMCVLLTYAAVGGSWHVPRVLLMSTNQHAGIAQWSLATAVLCLMLCLLFGQLMGMTGIGIGMLLSEVMIALVCVILSERLLRTSHQPAVEPSVSA